MPDGRGPLRLVLASPDGSRILARPNGLAGWALPVIAVTLPFHGWSDADVDRASAVIGSPVVPIMAIGTDAWLVESTGRISAAGTTWIGTDELDRLGADAARVRRWIDERPSFSKK